MATAWSPTIGNSVGSILVQGETVYFAAWIELAVVNRTTGLATGWHPAVRLFPDIAAAGSVLVVAGGFGTYGGLTLCEPDIFADGFESGDLSAWDVSLTGP